VEVLSNDTNYNEEILNNSKNSVQNKNDESTNFNKTKPQEESATLNKELAEVEVVEEEPELLFLSDIFDDEETESEVVTSQSNDDVLFDDDLLNRAKTAYENKDFENALSFVNKFLELSNFSIDEALFLKGQILEKPFAQRNIRDALDCYKKIISSYPQSDFWDKSDERIKYIQRFYFNIR
jgi:tetratricopeptide (TPR) repeat protein